MRSLWLKECASRLWRVDGRSSGFTWDNRMESNRSGIQGNWNWGMQWWRARRGNSGKTFWLVWQRVWMYWSWQSLLWTHNNEREDSVVAANAAIGIREEVGPIIAVSSLFLTITKPQTWQLLMSFKSSEKSFEESLLLCVRKDQGVQHANVRRRLSKGL